MKKSGIFFVMLFVIFGSNVFAQDYTDSKTLQVELEKGAVSFVKSVSPAYSKGIDVKSFKTKLIGEKNITTITKEADALLNEAYNLLSKNAPEDVIKKEATKEFAAVTVFVLKYAQDNKLKLDDNSGYIAAFGGDESGLSDLGQSVEGCKWYQVGCHLSNLWDWMGRNKETLLKIAELIIKIFLNK